MFDRHFHGGTTYVPYEKTVTVTEKRAPTDDSIRLVREYEDKAWLAVKSAVSHKLEGIEANFITMQDMFHSQQKMIAFKFNGQVIKIEVKEEDSHREMVMAIADKITAEIMGAIMKGMTQ